MFDAAGKIFGMKHSLPANMCIFLLLPVATAVLAQSHPQQVGIVTALPDRRTGKDFIQSMMMSSKFAIVTSKLALDRSHNPIVRNLAADTIAVHGKLSRDMKSRVDRIFVNRIVTAPPMFDPAHMKMYRPLEISFGEEFDQMYMSRQIWVHQELLDTVEGYAGNGKVAQLQNYAGQIVPVARDRLAMLRNTGAEVAVRRPHDRQER